jgi:hypothetical protein
MTGLLAAGPPGNNETTHYEERRSSKRWLQLRVGLDNALARAANDRRLPALEFTEVEQGLPATTVEMADWAERQKAVRDAEIAGQDRPHHAGAVE